MCVILVVPPLVLHGLELLREYCIIFLGFILGNYTMLPEDLLNARASKSRLLVYM